LDTGDTDYLSSLTRGTACAITGTPGDASDNVVEVGSIAGASWDVVPIDLDLDIVKREPFEARIDYAGWPPEMGRGPRMCW
jgi:hypothetical protein